MANTLDFLHGVETKEVINATGAIQTAKSSIIGLLMTAGKGPVNVPTLIAGNPREGVATFGQFAADGFSGPEALNGIFQQIGAMVVCINVCDPTKHYTEVTGESVSFGRDFKARCAHPYISDVALATSFSAPATVTSRGVALPAGITITSVKSVDGSKTYVKDTDYTEAPSADGASIILTPKTGGTFPPVAGKVVVAYTATVTENVDYTVSSELGAITRSSTGKIMNFATMTVNYTFVDPSKVEIEDYIGGVSAETGDYYGAQGFLGAEDALALVPRILIAPHQTHPKEDIVTANPVASALLGVAQELKSIVFVDGRNTTDEEAIQTRGDWGSDRIMVVDPWAKITGPDGADWLVPASVYWAGITAQTDNAIGFWASPSNKEIAGIIGTGRMVDFRMGSTNCRANYLNANQVSTIIRKNGYRTWGNHSTSIEPATSFLTARRTADMIEESIQESHLWAVDRVITKNYLIEVLENVGAYLRHLQQVGAIYGGSAWIDRELNSDDVIAGGQIYINYDFTCPKTAEHITFVASITDKYISNIFQDLTLTLANTSILNVSPTLGTAL